jgi:hypothetical protein
VFHAWGDETRGGLSLQPRPEGPASMGSLSAWTGGRLHHRAHCLNVLSIATAGATANTKYQKVRCGYAGLTKVYLIDILSPVSQVHGYTFISQGYNIIEKDFSGLDCLVHKYTSYCNGILNRYVRHMLDSDQNNGEIKNVYLYYIQGYLILELGTAKPGRVPVTSGAGVLLATECRH